MSLLTRFFKKEAQAKRGGYLALFGLWDWYDSQPTEVKDFLYKSCGYGINTDSRNLVEGEVGTIYVTDPNDPEKSTFDTATKFLCRHAVTAVSERNHTAANALMKKAFLSTKCKEDSLYYAMTENTIREKAEYCPDQKEVDAYKPILFQFIKDNPGILQSDIKKHFPSDLENIIGLAHWANFQEGKIRREKKGRSFQLWVNGDPGEMT